ncbi:MAG: hypothetical protein DMG67_19865 [Acidobacteria bacterium]|nr:MAG: hypothetical protein DMG67_19865 [Acidobacteriota bacterium]
MRVLRYLWVPLFSLTLMAQTTGSTGSTTPTRTRRKTATSARTRKSAAPTTTTTDEIRSLREALATQQQQIQQLTQQLQQRDQATQQQQQQINQLQTAASEAQTKASTAETTSTQTAESFTKLQSDVADMKGNATNAALSSQDDQKRLGAVEALLGRFRWSGDVRVRGESFFQNYSGCVACVDRNRARIHLRLGFEGKLNDDFIARVYMASGAVTNGAPSFVDPVSTNETLTSFFERKTIGFDRGYIIYQPQAAKWLKLTGGKFAYDFPSTNLTFDRDLNPEGFTEKFSFDFSHPILKNVTFEGMQLLFNEVAGGAAGAGVNRGVDSNALGGYVSAKFQFGPWTTTPSFTLLNWNGADPIAQAANPVPTCATATSTSCIPQPSITITGTPATIQLPTPISAAPRIINANALNNATYIKGTGSGQTRAFVSGFEYADFIWDNTLVTPFPRFPVRVVLEYEQNLRAKLALLAPPPSKQDKGYMADVSFGQQKLKHDIQLGYSFFRIEQDAVISQFNESDLRTATNVLQHRFYANWLVQPNVTAGFSWWIGRTLNRNLQNASLAPGLPAGRQDPWLNRLQFDLIYRF